MFEVFVGPGRVLGPRWPQNPPVPLPETSQDRFFLIFLWILMDLLLIFCQFFVDTAASAPAAVAAAAAIAAAVAAPSVDDPFAAAANQILHKPN